MQLPQIPVKVEDVLSCFSASLLEPCGLEGLADHAIHTLARLATRFKF